MSKIEINASRESAKISAEGVPTLIIGIAVACVFLGIGIYFVAS